MIIYAYKPATSNELQFNVWASSHRTFLTIKTWYKIKHNTPAVYTVRINRTLSVLKFVHRSWNDVRSNFALHDRLPKSNGIKYWFFRFFLIHLCLSFVRATRFSIYCLNNGLLYSYAPQINLTFFFLVEALVFPV